MHDGVGGVDPHDAATLTTPDSGGAMTTATETRQTGIAKVVVDVGG
jgi:hypothetical protein